MDFYNLLARENTYVVVMSKTNYDKLGFTGKTKFKKYCEWRDYAENNSPYKNFAWFMRDKKYASRVKSLLAQIGLSSHIDETENGQ